MTILRVILVLLCGCLVCLGIDLGQVGTLRVGSIQIGGASVESYTNVFAYYKLDEEGVVPLVDSTGNTNELDLYTYAGSPAYAAGIIGNAWAKYSFGAGVTNSALEFSGDDWAIRFWTKKTAAGSAGLMQRHDSIDGWVVNQVYDATSAKWSFYVWHDGDITGVATSGTYSVNTWHRIVIFHRAGIHVGIAVDADAAVLDEAFTDTMGLCTEPFKLMQGLGDGGVLVDEIAIWKGYIPTDAELLWDWNSGAGRTWPLVAE